MIKIKQAVIIFHFIFLFSSYAYPAIESSLFWEPEISNALIGRDEYYKQVGVKHNKTAFNILLTQNGSESLQEQLKLYKNPANPWYHFLSGIASLRLSLNDANKAFANAINTANNDPGLLWSLFFDFYYINQSDWADSCLKQLEKNFLSRGAQTAPVLSQQMLSFANSKRASGNNLAFRKYLEWSARFERFPFWQTFMLGWSSLPKHPELFFNACKECITMIKSSWFLQLSLLNYIYTWFRLAVLFFIIITITTLSLQVMPILLHPIIELFPSNLNIHFRSFLTLAMFASLSLFGIIPFFLFTAVIMWPYIHNWKKILLYTTVLLLVLSPFDARIREMFRLSLSNDEPIGLFRRSLYEGCHPSLENQVDQGLKNNNADHLLHICAAILNLKKNSISASTDHISNAEKIKSLDPAALLLAGNIYYSDGDFKLAQLYYQKCVESYPDYAAGWFNLGQFNLSMKNLRDGNEQITKAAALDYTLLNSFLGKNTAYFSDTLPLTRQFISGDYNPGYFWKKVFPRYTGTWKSSKKIWGLNVWGIPPLFFLLIAPIITIVLIILSIRYYNSSENILFCKICGNPMCRKCKIDKLCKNCILSTEAINDEVKQRQLKTKIKNQRYRLINLTGIVLNFLFPGAGYLYKNEKGNFFNIFLLIITSCVYAVYGSLLTFEFSYPFWVAQQSFIVIFICTLVYTGVFTIIFLKDLLTEQQPSEDKYVISWKSQ